jgi:prepilin-type N-terminal cleavage/methylation domain-containing protein
MRKGFTSRIQDPASRKGFTLVELMIAVSILCIGIVLVLRSFLNTASALESLHNQITAIQYLETKINALEQKAFQEEGVQPGDTQEELALGSRNALFRSEIHSLDIEELREDVNEIKMSLSWQEENKEKNELLVTYLPNKK